MEAVTHLLFPKFFSQAIPSPSTASVRHSQRLSRVVRQFEGTLPFV
jgi:hypothetical protein